MHKQPHRAVEKIADNRYWQNQFRVDDAELEAPADFEEYAPPTLPATHVAEPKRASAHDKQVPRESD